MRNTLLGGLTTLILGAGCVGTTEQDETTRQTLPPQQLERDEFTNQELFPHQHTNAAGELWKVTARWRDDPTKEGPLAFIYHSKPIKGHTYGIKMQDKDRDGKVDLYEVETTIVGQDRPLKTLKLIRERPTETYDKKPTKTPTFYMKRTEKERIDGLYTQWMNHGLKDPKRQK